MKFNSILFAVLVLLGGCGEPNLDVAETKDKILAEAIDADKIQQRGEVGEKLYYAPNEQEPYTYQIKEMYNNGKVKILFYVKDGKKDGLFTKWHENGQKREETNFKNGKLDGIGASWHENGQKSSEINFKNGKEDGLYTKWDENGVKQSEENYKDGKLDGQRTLWHDNGQKEYEGNYKDGKEVD